MFVSWEESLPSERFILGHFTNTKPLGTSRSSHVPLITSCCQVFVDRSALTTVQQQEKKITHCTRTCRVMSGCCSCGVGWKSLIPPLVKLPAIEDESLASADFSKHSHVLGDAMNGWRTLFLLPTQKERKFSKNLSEKVFLLSLACSKQRRRLED